MNVTYKGKTQTAFEWETELGFARGTIYSRILRGWPVEKALSAKVSDAWNKGGTMTKNNAELYLNDLPFADLPKRFQKLVSASTAKKYGRFIRTYHLKEFDKWYEKEYKVSHRDNDGREVHPNPTGTSVSGPPANGGPDSAILSPVHN